jgi:hypothetical protein
MVTKELSRTPKSTSRAKESSLLRTVTNTMGYSKTEHMKAKANTPLKMEPTLTTGLLKMANTKVKEHSRKTTATT